MENRYKKKMANNKSNIYVFKCEIKIYKKCYKKTNKKQNTSNIKKY